MRLVTFRRGGAAPAIGALCNNDRQIVDFAEAHARTGATPSEWFKDMLALMDGGDAAFDAASSLVERAVRGNFGPLLDADAVEFMAPVPVPRQIRDCLSFEKHFRQAREGRLRALVAKAEDPVAAEAELRASGRFEIPKAWYDLPLYYKANRFSVVGTGTDLIMPSYSKEMDYELEFGIFLKGPVKGAKAAEARKHIYGYTIFNDMSARDIQSIEVPCGMGPAKSKDFDTGNVMGPCLVTADEIPDPYGLKMEVYVNGTLRGSGNSRDMYHSFESMIERMTDHETLHTGEFIASGTVGDGSGVEFDTYLQHGDLIEMTVEKIGTLRNRAIRL
jgi:2-keto-4-pentenoate hydratase/2-oxohepta-3-ene-1,7-dioic acid hydratase in catechol pathway